MKPKQKQYPVVDVTGDRSKIQCCKEQYCIGTWNVRSIPFLSFIVPIFARMFIFIPLSKNNFVFSIFLYHFAFSYCSWGSQGKNTEVVCHSLLQWTTFCQISPPMTRPSWVALRAWLSFIELDKAVVLV